MVELAVFLIAGAICLTGALGVILNRNPVHAALSLVATLFGIAVLFIAQEAHFLAAVQVIVYAGAIVILFLFVLMLLGVDQAEDLSVEPIRGQRIGAAIVGIGALALTLIAFASTSGEATGARPEAGAPNEIAEGVADIEQIGEGLFTEHLLALEVTSVLLVIAIVGAVMMARRARREDMVVDPLVEAHEAELEAAAAALAEARGADEDEDEDEEVQA